MSLRLKLFLSLFLLSFLPFFAVFLILFKYEENLLKENIKKQQYQNTELVRRNIQEYFLSLQKNLKFWAKAQILDDILINDIDKRIQIFLDQINKNYNIQGEIYIINKNGKVIASTDKKSLSKNIYRLYTDDVIFISYPIFSSFSREKIGDIIYIQSPETLKSFLFRNNLTAFSIYNKRTNYKVGYIEHLPYEIRTYPEYETDRYIFFSIPFLEKPLKNWILISRISKDIVFLPLVKVREYFLFFFVVGLIFISILSFISSEKIVRPIISLAETMEKVVKTKNYSLRFIYKPKDEIGILVSSFNFMLSEIEKALKKIEEENRKRLYLFKNLIDIFKKITSLQNEKEVLNVAVDELRKFLDMQVYFSSKKENNYSFPVRTEKIDGYLVFETNRKIKREEVQFLRSITELINLLLEKVYLINKAQEASKAKSSFISNISHELRTPLNSIIGFSQYLQTVEEDEIKKQALNSIEVSGKHLLEIINDILDYAKVEAGAVEVKRDFFSLKDFMEEVKKIVEPLIQKKGLRLILPDRDMVVYSDKKLLKQILLNLLSNSIKFTEKGYIRISVWKEKGKIFFSVKDTGIGIEPENLEKVFSSFFQLENPLQKKYKGTGLGLSISKEYVHLLGGEIFVKSEGKGKGSEFIFYIPEENSSTNLNKGSS